MRCSIPGYGGEYVDDLLREVLDDSVEAELGGVFGHVGVGGDLDEVHFGDGDVTGGAVGGVGSQALPELLMVEDGCFEVDSFDEVFLDEEDGCAGLFVSLELVGDSLHGWGCTVSLTSGGVKVKTPSLGMLTPLPMRRFLLM